MCEAIYFDKYEICPTLYDKYVLCENQLVPDYTWGTGYVSTGLAQYSEYEQAPINYGQQLWDESWGTGFGSTGLAVLDFYKEPEIDYDFDGGVGNQTFQMVPDSTWNQYVSTGLVYTGGAFTYGQTGIDFPDWEPSNDSSVIAQWDASDSTTITESMGSVTQVASKVNVGNFTLNANGTPTTTTVNGLGAIDLVSDDDEYLATDGNSNFGITDGNIIIVGALVIEDVDNNRDSIWSIGDDSGGANDAHFRAIHFAGHGSFTNQFMGGLETENLGNSSANLAGGRSRQVTGGPYSGNTIHATMFDFTNSDIILNMNGEEQLNISNEYLTKVNMSNSTFSINTNRGQARDLDGKFCELLIFNSNNTSLIEKAEGYLAHKWGMESLLPIGHTYKNNPPKA